MNLQVVESLLVAVAMNFEDEDSVNILADACQDMDWDLKPTGIASVDYWKVLSKVIKEKHGSHTRLETFAEDVLPAILDDLGRNYTPYFLSQLPIKYIVLSDKIKENPTDQNLRKEFNKGSFPWWNAFFNNIKPLALVGNLLGRIALMILAYKFSLLFNVRLVRKNHAPRIRLEGTSVGERILGFWVPHVNTTNQGLFWYKKDIDNLLTIKGNIDGEAGQT